MVKLQFGSLSVLLLQAVSIFAAPPTPPQPAQLLPEAITLATATASPATGIVEQERQQLQAELKAKRADDASSDSFPDASSSISLPGPLGNATSASSADDGIATGMFTGADGGYYEVTSQSGYVVIDGKTLSAGQEALIGNGDVSEGTDGLVANGQTVALVAVSTTSVTTSTEAASSSTSSGSASTAAASSAPSSAASSSSTAAAAPTGAGNAYVAAVGGLLGLMIL